jgi:hypothetical protein
VQILSTDSQLASPVVPPAAISLTDEEVVARVCAGDSHVFEILMRRYNQRLYPRPQPLRRFEESLALPWKLLLPRCRTVIARSSCCAKSTG